jgi:uncharacterized membrane protein YhaH (DUF805 family)
MTSGMHSSEFWLTVLVIIIASALLFTGKITEGTWAIAAGLQGGGVRHLAWLKEARKRPRAS